MVHHNPVQFLSPFSIAHETLRIRYIINTCGYEAFWITLDTYIAPSVKGHTGPQSRGETSVPRQSSHLIFLNTEQVEQRCLIKLCCLFQIPSPPVGIMHCVSLNWVLKRTCITLLAEQQALVEAVGIYYEHYDFNSVWEIHILDNNTPYPKNYLGCECVGTEEKAKAKGQIASWCKLPAYTTWKCQTELWTVWPRILSLLTSLLTVSCAVLLVVKPLGWLRFGLVKWQVRRQKKKKGRKPSPPRLCEEIFGDFILGFKCRNVLDPFWFCFSDHH